MKSLKVTLTGLVVATLLWLSIGPAFAAQGQITEVNPSGIGSIKINPSENVRVEPPSARGIITDVNPSGTVSVTTPGLQSGDTHFDTGISQ